MRDPLISELRSYLISSGFSDIHVSRCKDKYGRVQHCSYRITAKHPEHGILSRAFNLKELSSFLDSLEVCS